MTFDFTANFPMFSFLINDLTITPRPSINIYGHQIQTKHTWKFQPKLLSESESCKTMTCNGFIFSVNKTCVLSFFLSPEPLLFYFFMWSVVTKNKQTKKPHPIQCGDTVSHWTASWDRDFCISSYLQLRCDRLQRGSGQPQWPAEQSSTYREWVNIVGLIPLSLFR